VALAEWESDIPVGSVILIFKFLLLSQCVTRKISNSCVMSIISLKFQQQSQV